MIENSHLSVKIPSKINLNLIVDKMLDETTKCFES